MSGRARHRRPLESFADRLPDAVDHEMRTAVLLAWEEIPPDLRARIAIARPRVDWQGYDDARRLVAEHLVVRIRELVECSRRGSAARGGHG
ncbi:hypothetical protein E3C22_19520 [Jiella endophytica]|uniref:Uncharacterized protein n=1 Tax=Jiella endophytica TaxID=2558362 RepID=A0A4Y8REF7_9HYPH|nr:hypothetical protein [Jiella endophytica]TFF19856.1 hypothetical protein E3C22_19520 [Jiella endophytica]